MPGNLLPPLLLTKLVSPLPISCACVSNCRVLVRLACVSFEPPPYVYAHMRICVRLRALRLLRPSYESPLTPWGRRSWPVFPLPRALPVFPPHRAVWSPSRRYRVAVTSRSRAPRLLRPSSESPGSTGYQIGPCRGALTSSLGRAGSYIVEFDMPAYPGLYPSFLVIFPYQARRPIAFHKQLAATTNNTGNFISSFGYLIMGIWPMY